MHYYYSLTVLRVLAFNLAFVIVVSCFQCRLVAHFWWHQATIEVCVILRSLYQLVTEQNLDVNEKFHQLEIKKHTVGCGVFSVWGTQVCLLPPWKATLRLCASKLYFPHIVLILFTFTYNYAHFNMPILIQTYCLYNIFCWSICFSCL